MKISYLCLNTFSKDNLDDCCDGKDIDPHTMTKIFGTLVMQIIF